MNKVEALGLPPGSVRAILALVLLGILVYCTIARVPVSETVGTLTGTAIGFYFGSGKAKQ